MYGRAEVSTLGTHGKCKEREMTLREVFGRVARCAAGWVFTFTAAGSLGFYGRRCAVKEKVVVA